MSKPEYFPWAMFSGNTLRPMLVDLCRAAGSHAVRLNKEDTIALLQKVEKHGLQAAMKDIPAEASTSKRKHEAPDDAESAEPARKRGRQPKVAFTSNAAEGPSTPVRTRSRRTSDPGQGLLTRRQAAHARGDNVPTRSWKPSTRAPRKSSQKASGSASAPPPQKPKSKGQVFDGVVLTKRSEIYSGKGKARAQAEVDQDTPEGEEGAGSDQDAEGEVEDEMEMEMEDSSLENSNKENDPTFLEIANAESTDGEADAEGEDTLPAEEIGSPAPQITVEPTDDQIEDARNHDVSIEIGSPAPEIHIEPTADDGAADEIEFETNGDANNTHGGGLLRPRINTHFRAGSLNPEYSIEVYSPTSEQHDSDDEMWVAAGVNGHINMRAAGGGLNSLD